MGNEITSEKLAEVGFECYPVETWTGNGTEPSETSKTVQQDYVKWFSDLSNAFIVRYEEWYWRKDVDSEWHKENYIIVLNNDCWYPRMTDGIINVLYEIKDMNHINDIFKAITGFSIYGKEL